MASGNFTTGSLTPSITQLAACGSTSNVVSGGHQFEESEAMVEIIEKGGIWHVYLDGCLRQRFETRKGAECYVRQMGWS